MERSHSCSNFVAVDADSNDNLPAAVEVFAPSKPLRKKRLQRQPITVQIDDELDAEDDMYAADLEDLEETEDALVMPRLPKHLPPAALALQRHMSSSSSGSGSCSQMSPTRRCLRHEESFDSCRSVELSPLAQRQRFNNLLRDSSVQSDSSRYSSVDSLLESLRPDPEAILINLFGPIGSEDILSRIPKRFLKPSQVRGIDTEAFVKRLQLASSLADSSVLGYRGLTGNPDQPPSSIVAKIMERFEVNQRKKSMGSLEHSIQ